MLPTSILRLQVECLLCHLHDCKLTSCFHTLQWLSVANLVDSAAHFDSRAVEYGIPDALLQSLKDSGFTTLGQLAFAVNRPGQETDDVLLL